MTPFAPAEVLDARALPCAGKHALIFRRWAGLGIGGSFVLLNDHRPEPLRRQFERLVPDCFAWEEIPAAGAWAVRLTRLRPDPAGFDPAQAAGCGPPPAGGDGDDGLFVRLQLDYRSLDPVVARGRLRQLAGDLAGGVALEVALVAPDPGLEEALTARGLTYSGGRVADDRGGWRYAIRWPASSPA